MDRTTHWVEYHIKVMKGRDIEIYPLSIPLLFSDGNKTLPVVLCDDAKVATILTPDQFLFVVEISDEAKSEIFKHKANITLLQLSEAGKMIVDVCLQTGYPIGNFMGVHKVEYRKEEAQSPYAKVLV